MEILKRRLHNLAQLQSSGREQRSSLTGEHQAERTDLTRSINNSVINRLPYEIDSEC